MIKRILLYGLILIIGAIGGASGIVFGAPSLLSHAPRPVVESAPFNSAKAISITESGIQSNLSGSNHYVRFDVEFLVSPPALIAQGGSAQGASGGGTGSPALDARIRNALINLARSTSYSQLNSSGGTATFRLQVDEVLQSVFGPGTIGRVYFPSLLTQ